MDGTSSAGGAVISLIVSIFAIIGLGAMLMIHFYMVSHGSSSQVIIDNQMQNYGISLSVYVVIGLVGALLYEYLDTQTNKYGLLFGFAMISFLLSNIALTMSLYQIKTDV